jgi:FHS family L-fucose permease-like MFS transporter
MGQPSKPVTSQFQSTGGEPRLFTSGYALPFFLVTALFLFWGIPSSMNDILIKQFMKSFEITRTEAGLIQSAYYLGYFFLSIPAALIMRKFSYKTGLVIGLLLYSLGTFLFWPAAIVRQYWFFLTALFIVASGASFLETGANPFIAVLGDPRTSERRLNFSQAFNPIGAISGVLVGTVFIFSGIELRPPQIAALRAAGQLDAYLQRETMRVVTPYLVIGAVIFVWALLIMRTKFPKIAEEAQTGATREKGRFLDLFHHRHLVLGVVAQFLYVGAQVGTWSFFIQYIQDYTHQPEKIAGYLLTGTLVAFGVGRFFSTYLMEHFVPSKLMGLYGIANCALVGIGVLMPGWVGVIALFLTSFFMSLMFPTIFALGIKELGPLTKVGSSLMIMSIIGGAVFPPIEGLIYGATHSMAIAIGLLLFCYAFITHYGFVGCRVRTRQA